MPFKKSVKVEGGRLFTKLCYGNIGKGSSIVQHEAINFVNHYCKTGVIGIR